MTAPLSHRDRRGFRPLAALLLLASVVTTSVTHLPTSADAADVVAGASPGGETRFALPDGPNSLPTDIVTATDGALWILESNPGRLVRMAPDGTMTRIAIEGDRIPTTIAVGPNGTVYWGSRDLLQWGMARSNGETLRWLLDSGGNIESMVLAGDRPWLVSTGSKWLKTRNPSTGWQDTYGPAVGGGHPRSISLIQGRFWVSVPDVNSVFIIEPADHVVKQIALPSPGVVREGDGGVLVASAGGDLVKFGFDGVPTGVHYPVDATARVTDVIASGQEVWYNQFGSNTITVASRIPGRPAVADIRLPDDPSDVTLGQDGSIWYTSYFTGEVVRIARDYVPPTPSDPSDLLAYAGEPLGPIEVDDDGRADVSSALRNTVLPSGMTSDPNSPSKIIGTPTSASNGLFVVQQTSRYYGENYSLSSYTRNLFVRDKPTVRRVAGADRYATAIAVSTFTPTSDTVYLASGEKFADALSAGPGAIADRAPLLLTPGAVLPDAVAGEILRLQARRVVVVGGPASVSDAVLAQLRALGDGRGGALAVERVSGADRYEASRNLVARIDRTTADSPLFIAAGGNFPDALSGAPAAAARNGSLLLVDGAASSLPAATLALIAAKGYRAVTIAGGPASVSPGIESQLAGLGVAVNRVSGSTRFETSVALNRYTLTAPGFVAHVAENPVPLDPRSQVFLASGETFPDALAAGAFAGLWKTPLYVVQRTCAPRAALLDVGSTGATFVAVFGGTSTLSTEVDSLAVCP